MLTSNPTLRKLALGLALTSVLVPAVALADPLPFFDTIPDGRAYFDSRVNSANGTLYTYALSGLVSGTNTWVLPDFTITSTDGGNRSVSTTHLNTNFAGIPALSAEPGGDAITMTANGQVDSGLTFTFNSAINGFGLDLDDWATCCFPSGLYISFNGGTPILVGEAAVGNDNPGIAAGHGPKTFIGAIDDSGTFTTITFYGTGSGDVLRAGGLIRYALVPLGSISGGYVQTSTATPVLGLAEYFDRFDDSGPRQVVANYLNTLSREEVTQALKTIFPVNTSVTGQTALNASGQTASVLLEKVGTVLGKTSSMQGMNFTDGNFSTSQWIFGDKAAAGRAGLGGDIDPVMALAATPYKKFQTGQNAFWINGVAAGANGSSTATTMGYDTFSRGIVAGYEIAIDENHLLGVIGSSFFSDIDIDNNAGKTDAENYNMGFYGQKLLGETKLTGLVTGGYSNYETVRRIDLGGVTANPESDYDGWSVSSSIGASHLFTHDNLQIEPYVQLSYTKVWTDGYNETNGGAFNMSVERDSFSVAGGKIGARFKTDLPVADKKLEITLSPYVGKDWELESSGAATSLVGTGVSTSVEGRSLTTHQIGFSTELAMEVSESTTVKLGADLSKDKYEDRYIAFVGLGYKF